MSTRKQVLLAAAALCAATFTVPASAHDEPVVGTLAGAGIGAAIGGPPGAAVGAVLGAIMGATVAHDTDHEPGHRHHHSRYERHSRDYIAPVRYNGNGHGAVAYCDEKPGYYRPTVVRVEERARPVRVKTVTTTTKMRKVCRYQPVRTTRVTERVVVASR